MARTSSEPGSITSETRNAIGIDAYSIRFDEFSWTISMFTRARSRQAEENDPKPSLQRRASAELRRQQTVKQTPQAQTRNRVSHADSKPETCSRGHSRDLHTISATRPRNLPISSLKLSYVLSRDHLARSFHESTSASETNR